MELYVIKQKGDSMDLAGYSIPDKAVHAFFDYIEAQNYIVAKYGYNFLEVFEVIELTTNKFI